MTKKKQTKTPKKKKNTPKKERVLTRDEFFKILDKVIQPLPQAKQTRKGKKGTSA